MLRPRPVFLYDGDCGVCDEGTARMRARMRPPVDFVPYQRADLTDFAFPPEALSLGPVLVEPGGAHHVGAAAVAAVMRSARQPYRTVGGILAAPGVRAVAQRVGAAMYRNRHRMPGAAGTCATEPAVSAHPPTTAVR